MGDKNSTSQTAPKLPNWSTDLLFGGQKNKATGGLALDLLTPGARDQAFSRMFMDPNAVGNMNQVLESTMRGDKLNVMGDPAVQNYISALTNQSNSNLAGQLGNLRSQAALSGHTQTGGSSALMQAQANAIGGAQTGLNSVLAPTLLDLYRGERQNQLNSVGAYGQLQQTPMQMFMQLMQLVTGQKSSTPNPELWMTVAGQLSPAGATPSAAKGMMPGGQE